MKRVGYYLTKALPQSKREWLVRLACARRYRSAALQYPLETEQIRSLLFILPESPLEALYQIENVAALRERFPSASATFLCVTDVAEYFRSVLPEGSYIAYDLSDRYLYSPVFTAFGISIAHERPDICFLLERHPDLSLLKLVGQTGATVRAGYAGAGDYPFLNHVVKPSPEHRYRADINGALARSLGARPARAPRLVVARDAGQGVRKLLRDLSVPEQAPLVVVDAAALVRLHGREWTGLLLDALRASSSITFCYLSAPNDNDELGRWLVDRGLVVIPPLSVPRRAALVARASLVIAGASVLLRLALLLGRDIAAVVHEGEAETLIPKGVRAHVASFSGAPDDSTVAAVVAALQASLVPPKSAPQ